MSLQFEWIAGVIPPGRALILFSFFAGAGRRHVYVPVTYRPDSLVGRLIGEEAARALICQFPGETIELSSLSSLTAVRNLGPVWGATRRDPAARTLTLADGLELTDRRIRQLRQQLRVEGWPGLEELLPAEAESEATV